MSSEPDDSFGVTFLVRHAWLSLRSAVAVALVEHGLSVQQYGALLVLTHHPGRTVAELGRVVGTARQSANELVTGLEKADLVERRPNPNDRRTQQLFLTKAGVDRLAVAAPAVLAVEAEIEASLADTDRTTARDWLAHMVRNAGR
ncbi:MarR family winged helix-turn-helix transcriptional regulator [Kribbella sp. NPDC056951]|uniref:MarR family winged helix-turn-helix transcriptional regulator n=1 Tax=Kribbella sp. NPDC056951 TaxID=3345978 RepID=UPI00363FC4E0